MSGHDRTFAIEPSRWQWNRFKDYFHYYCMLGLIPVGAVITLTNVFVGPATLSEIPEGYTPKYWEYYRVYNKLYTLLNSCDFSTLGILKTQFHYFNF